MRVIVVDVAPKAEAQISKIKVAFCIEHKSAIARDPYFTVDHGFPAFWITPTDFQRLGLCIVDYNIESEFGND